MSARSITAQARARAGVWLLAALLVACGDAGPELGDRRARPAEPGPSGATRASTSTPAPAGMIGVLVPEAEVVLTATSLARLEHLDKRVGDRVVAGELVAMLEVTGDRSELASAKAAWKAAKAELERLELELEQAKASRADVEQLEDYVSKAELRERRFAEQLADARKRSAGASLSRQRIEIEAASKRIAEAELRAPFDAVIGQRYVDVGATLGPGEPVVELISQTRLIRFAVPEGLAKTCTLGARVEVQFPEAKLTIAGEIRTIAPEIDAGTRLLIAEAQLAEQPPLRVGTVARVRC